MSFVGAQDPETAIVIERRSAMYADQLGRNDIRFMNGCIEKYGRTKVITFVALGALFITGFLLSVSGGAGYLHYRSVQNYNPDGDRFLLFLLSCMALIAALLTGFAGGRAVYRARQLPYNVQITDVDT